MKISLLTPESGNVKEWGPEFEKRGYQVLINDATEDCDFIVCASISQVRRLEHFHIPMINYNWDFYQWVFRKSCGFEWELYGEYLKKSLEVWVPSDAVSKRTNEFYPGIKDKCVTIKTYGLFFDTEDIKNDGYIYNPIRDAYQLDPNYGMIDKVCSELDIPLFDRKSYGAYGSGLPLDEYRKKIAHCSFIVCELNEMSTGGLSLLEAYRLGKPILISDSSYEGAYDYFGDRAYYFRDGDYEDFKRKVNDLWKNTPELDKEECKKYVDGNFSVDVMMDYMSSRLEHLRGNDE